MSERSTMGSSPHEEAVVLAVLVVVALFALLGWAASRWGADSRQPGELRWASAGSGCPPSAVPRVTPSGLG
jgi:hypothetical protein